MNLLDKFLNTDCQTAMDTGYTRVILFILGFVAVGILGVLVVKYLLSLLKNSIK